MYDYFDRHPRMFYILVSLVDLSILFVIVFILLKFLQWVF